MKRAAGITAMVWLVAAWCSGCTVTPGPAATSPPTVALLTVTPPEPDATATPVQAASPTALPSGEAVPTLPVPESPDPVELAIRVLSGEIGVPTDGIEVVETIPVQWNDSSLGCPQPEQAYLQVITPGYLVTLLSGETSYHVHTDLAGTAVVCFNTEDPIGPGTVPDPIAAEFIMQARADLAARLGINPEEVVLVRSDAVEWSGSNLGCHQEGEESVMAATAGYRIVLAVGEERYEYHTDQQRMIACDEPTE